MELMLWRKQWTKGNGGNILKGRRGQQDYGLALLDLFTGEWRSIQEWIAAGQSRGDLLSPLCGV